MHQRQRRRRRRVLRRGHVDARRPAPGRAAAGRRLELRGRERRDGVVVRDDDQRPRGPARARAGRRWIGGGGRGTPTGRGIPAGAPAVPAQVDGRGDRSRAGSDSRSPTGTSTTSSAGSSTCAPPGWSPTSASPRPIKVVEGNRDADGRWPLQNVHEGDTHFEMEDGRGPAEPLEHAPCPARARLGRRRHPCRSEPARPRRLARVVGQAGLG